MQKLRTFSFCVDMAILYLTMAIIIILAIMAAIIEEQI